MAHRIEKTEDFIEVHLSGETHEEEILIILWKLHQLIPRKEISDVWLLDEACVVPWQAYSKIVRGIAGLMSSDMITSKSAIVVSNHFQMAQAEMFREEAKCLPYEIGVFMSREESARWLKA